MTATTELLSTEKNPYAHRTDPLTIPLTRQLTRTSDPPCPASPTQQCNHNTETDRRIDALISLMEKIILEKNNPTTNSKVHPGNQGKSRGERKKFPYNKNDYCGHCDMKGHSDQNCQAKNNVCNKCHIIGHFYNGCPQNPKNTAVNSRPEPRPSRQSNIPSAMPRQQTPENY